MKKWKHPVLPRHRHCTTTTHCWSWHCHVLTCRALWLWSRHQWRTVPWSSISHHGDTFASRLWTQHTLNVWACVLVTSNIFRSVLNWVVCCCSCCSAPQPNTLSKFTPSQKSAAFPGNYYNASPTLRLETTTKTTTATTTNKQPHHVIYDLFFFFSFFYPARHVSSFHYILLKTSATASKTFRIGPESCILLQFF